jgi:hypothetical protein
MKQVATIAALVVVLAWSAPAEVQRFPVIISGQVDSDGARVTVTDQSIVSTPGNRLVLVIDIAHRTVALQEWTADLKTQVDRDRVLGGVQSVMENFRMAVIAGTTMNANLEMVDMDWNDDGINDHDGNLMLTAKLKVDAATAAIAGISGSIVGVFNDRINGGTFAGDQLLKAKLKTAGPAF